MIDPTTIEVLEECSRRSVAENITFPEVVQRLASAGVEFYYTDLYQHRKTYYFPNGDARTIQDDLPNQPAPAIDFSADEVSSAIKKIQRGEIQYREFLRLILAAGNATYTVYIAGKRAVYVGRNGDSYT
ncbi:MAG: hypothetical protein WA426_13885, partial [Silvibacterium sp.]